MQLHVSFGSRFLFGVMSVTVSRAGLVRCAQAAPQARCCAGTTEAMVCREMVGWHVAVQPAVLEPRQAQGTSGEGENGRWVSWGAVWHGRARALTQLSLPVSQGLVFPYNLWKAACLCMCLPLIVIEHQNEI